MPHDTSALLLNCECAGFWLCWSIGWCSYPTARSIYEEAWRNSARYGTTLCIKHWLFPNSVLSVLLLSFMPTDCSFGKKLLITCIPCVVITRKRGSCSCYSRDCCCYYCHSNCECRSDNCWCYSEEWTIWRKRQRGSEEVCFASG